MVVIISYTDNNSWVVEFIFFFSGENEKPLTICVQGYDMIKAVFLEGEWSSGIKNLQREKRLDIGIPLENNFNHSAIN